MGIFSNICSNPECNARVPKAAKFCNVCGEPASAADTNCGRCGAVVGAQSKYCWKCGVNLADQQKAPLFDNRWVRGEDDFAIRVDECDVKGFLTKGLIVEHGTRGMIFQRGRFCGYIDEGSYDVNGFLKKVNNFNQTTPSSVVLVDAGDVELSLEAIKLYSQDQMEVDATFKALARLNDPEKLYTNAFKSRNQLSVGYLAGSLTNELRSALQTYVGMHSIEELYSNPQLRQEVERQMQLELEPIMERLGLDIVQLRFIDFVCPDYEPIRKEQARAKLAQRLREIMTTDRMSEIKSEKDLEDFIRQTEHELEIKGLIRADEMDRLKRQFMFNRDKEILAQQIEIEGIRNEAERHEAKLKLIAEIERRNIEHQAQLQRDLSQAKNDLEVKRIKLEMERLEAEQDFWEAEKAIELRKKSQMAELEVEREKIKAYSEATPEALIGIVDGPAAERIMKLEELRAKERLTPEQILAMTAAASPEAAKALAEKYKADGALNEEKLRQYEKFSAQQREDYKEASDRLERVTKVALEQMGMTSTARAQAHGPGSQTVVAGGGMGSPTIINPQRQTGEKTCPKCKQMIPTDSRFCPNCREKL